MMVNPKCVLSKNVLVYYSLQFHHEDRRTSLVFRKIARHKSTTKSRQRQDPTQDLHTAYIIRLCIALRHPKENAKIYLPLYQDSRKPEPGTAGVMASGCVFETG